MNPDLNCSIVIPTWNERDNIVQLLHAIRKACPSERVRIVVVDENSADGTADAARVAAASLHGIRVMSNPGAKGLSPSIVAGFDSCDSEFLCCMDADLQHSPEDLQALFAKAAEGADIVLGTRYAAGGRIDASWSPFRRLCSGAATLLARLVLGVSVSDPMSGFFLIRTSVYRRIRPTLNPRGYKILLELLYLASLHGAPRVSEAGITFHSRKAGESKLGLRVSIDYLRMLVELRTRLGKPA